MPTINLTIEEIDLVIDCVKKQRGGDLVRWKTLSSFLSGHKEMHDSLPEAMKHLQKQQVYSDLILKLKEAKKPTNTLFLTFKN